MSDSKATSAEAAPSPTASNVDGHAPQKKRIRAVVACSHCRSKRSKCDGIPGQQACSQCRQRGIECEMSDGKRNRGHYKPQAEALAKRVRTLELALAEAQAANRQLVMQMQQQQQQRQQQQQQQQQHNTQQHPDSSFVPVSSTAWDPNGHHMQMDDVSGVSVGFGLQDHRLDRLDVESVHSMVIPPRAESIAASSTMPPPPHAFSPSMHQNPQHLRQQSIPSHNHNLLLDHGSIVMSNVGTEKLYSGTSANNQSHAHNYALSVSQSSIEPSPQTVPVPPPATQPSIHTVNLAVPIPIMRRQPYCATLDLSSSAVDYLLGLFFHRYQLMMKFVSQQDFMTQYAENTDADDRDGNGTASSNNNTTSKSKPRSFKQHHPCCHKQNCALFLAMLAAAIRYSTRTDVTERFLRSDGENKLATAACRAVETEVSRPTLATIQTILILCEVETTVDNQMTSYMYSCLASKLIFEMGLDLGSSTSSKALTAEETTIRHWLVWAASVHDQFWAVFLRRPLAIKNSALQLSRMAWRFAGGGDRKSRGLQHHINSISNDSSNDTPEETRLITPPTFEDEVNEYLMDFMELAREITDALYGTGSLLMLQSRSSSSSQAATAAQAAAQHTAASSLNNGGFSSGSDYLGFGYDNAHSNRTDASNGGSSIYYNQYDSAGLPHILHEHAVQQQANDQLPDVEKLNARLDQWFGTLSEKVRQGPVSGQDCYHFLFVLHLHFNATKIILHRTRAFATQIGGGSPLSFNNCHRSQDAADAVTAADKQRRQPSSGSYPTQSPLASVVSSNESAASSMAALGQASICIAKLFETFRRREDIRTLQCTGVQWAAMASEALTWYIETLPIDGAIEAVAHLQSLARTIKDMTRTFLPAVYTYDRTTNALRMFQQRIDGGSDSPPQIQTLQALRQEQQQYQQRLASQVSTSAAMNGSNLDANTQSRSISSFDMDMSVPAAHAHAHAQQQNQHQNQPFSLDTSSLPSVPELASSVSVSAATFTASLAAAGAFDTDSVGGGRIGAGGNVSGSVSSLTLPASKEQLQHTDTVYIATPGQDLTPKISEGAIQVGWPENGDWDWGDMLDRQ